MARFNRIGEVSKCGNLEGWSLCFQYGTYHYDNGNSEKGFRFIWRHNGKLKPQRGQARIPSWKDLFELLTKAYKNKDFKESLKDIKCESYPYCLIVKLLAEINVDQK